MRFIRSFFFVLSFKNIVVISPHTKTTSCKLPTQYSLYQKENEQHSLATNKHRQQNGSNRSKETNKARIPRIAAINQEMNHLLICLSLFRTERHNEKRRQKEIHHQQRQRRSQRSQREQRRSRMRISRVRDGQQQQLDQQLDQELQQHAQKLDLCSVTTTSMARRMDMEQLEKEFDDKSHGDNEFISTDGSHHKQSSTTNLSSSLRSSSQQYSSSPSPISILRINSTDLSLFY